MILPFLVRLILLVILFYVDVCCSFNVTLPVTRSTTVPHYLHGARFPHVYIATCVTLRFSTHTRSFSRSLFSRHFVVALYLISRDLWWFTPRCCSCPILPFTFLVRRIYTTVLPLPIPPPFTYVYALPTYVAVTLAVPDALRYIPTRLRFHTTVTFVVDDLPAVTPLRSPLCVPHWLPHTGFDYDCRCRLRSRTTRSHTFVHACTCYAHAPTYRLYTPRYRYLIYTPPRW